MTLDLTGKRCPVIFSAVLFFVFEKFFSTSTDGKCALRWFYCLEKQKLSLERTLPGKKLCFCIRYLWKRKEKPANLNRGVCFSMKWKATCRNWAHLDEEKQFGLSPSIIVVCADIPALACAAAGICCQGVLSFFNEDSPTEEAEQNYYKNTPSRGIPGINRLCFKRIALNSLIFCVLYLHVQLGSHSILSLFATTQLV